MAHAAPEAAPQVAPAAEAWKTGLFECTAPPGGSGLCLKSCFCPCIVIGDLNEKTKGPGGELVGCLASAIGCCPCMMAIVAPKVKPGEEAPTAFIYSCLPCTCCCYLIRVHNQYALAKPTDEVTKVASSKE